MPKHAPHLSGAPITTQAEASELEYAGGKDADKKSVVSHDGRSMDCRHLGPPCGQVGDREIGLALGAATLAELALATLILAFVIQWPLSYGQYVQVHNRFVGDKSDPRQRDG